MELVVVVEIVIVIVLSMSSSSCSSSSSISSCIRNITKVVVVVVGEVGVTFSLAVVRWKCISSGCAIACIYL